MKQAILSYFGHDFSGFYSRYLPDLRHNKANCPFHDCDSRSLSVEPKSGLFNCHFPACAASGDVFTFYARKHDLNGDFPAVLRGIAADFDIANNGAKPDKPRKLVKRYAYQGPDGTDLFYKNRFEPKDFSLCRPNGESGYVSGMGDVEPVLYNLPAVIEADEVWIVEGEKDADNLNGIGFTATTNFDGAGKWRESYTEALRGKAVFIIPDNDDEGRKHAQKVARELQGRAKSIRLIALPGLPPKGDVSDFLQAIGDPDTAAERLSTMAEGAGEWAPPAEPEQPTPPADRARKDIRVINAGTWLETDPPPPDHILEDTLDAGDKMAILASSKLRKSFFFGQLAIALAAHPKFLGWIIPKNRRVLFCQFEIRDHHCHRRIRNMARAMGISAAHLGDRLMIINGRGLGLAGKDGLGKIMAAIGDFKPEVIMIDPLYKFSEGVENAAEDFKKLLNAFDELAEQTGAAIIYVHHDTKGSPGDKDIRDRGAGSNVLGRDYDACVTLTAHASDPDATVVEVLLRNYPPQAMFTIVWSCDEVPGGYRFNMAEDIMPFKRTSRTKPAPPVLSTYLPAAADVLVGKNKLEIGFFRSAFKEKTGLSDIRIRDFIAWATGDKNPPMRTLEERGKGIHRKWIFMSEAN
jgi:hypothetical protein